MDDHCQGTQKRSRIPFEILDHGDSNRERLRPISQVALELLNKYRSGLQRFSREIILYPSFSTKCKQTDESSPALTTLQVIKIAKARFIECFHRSNDDLSCHSSASSLDTLFEEDAKNVELVQLLLAAAEKVSYRQFDHASNLLSMCDQLASISSNPVQRIVYYFVEALKERISKETGRISSKWLEIEKGSTFNLEEAILCPTPAMLACHLTIPFNQIAQFAGIQSLVENVSKAKKIHVIDLAIRYGVQWTVLMQALVARHECPLELLTITAVGTTPKHIIEETGKRLTCFAETVNLPFSFKIVTVADVRDLKEDLFGLEADEMVAVYTGLFLNTLLAHQDRLDSLMILIQNLHPFIIVVTELEANLNSPVFTERFIETLFYYSAYFDCLNACMDHYDMNRMTLEAVYFSKTIHNIMSTEDRERTFRLVKVDAWRDYFRKFGMVETELSMASLYQANLMAKEFPCGSSCTLDIYGKCLTVGW